MSAINCPFDGDFCQKKDVRFHTWQKTILQTDGVVFQINPDMFADCTIEDEKEREKNCTRYQRYLFFENNIKNGR